MAKQNYQPPRLTLPVGERDHIEGPSDARMVLVEYGDYQCPYCGAAYPIVKKVQKELGTKLRFVFRNFPITTSHPQAEWAAETAEAAAVHSACGWEVVIDRKSTRLNSSHLGISYAVFCLKKKRRK